jgi:hypothetical protein
MNVSDKLLDLLTIRQLLLERIIAGENIAKGKPNPYGNPIPGIATRASTGGVSSTALLDDFAGEVDSVATTVHSLGEQLQVDEALLEQFDAAGVRPLERVAISNVDGFVRITSSSGVIDLSEDAAQHLFVTR